MGTSIADDRTAARWRDGGDRQRLEALDQERQAGAADECR